MLRLTAPQRDFFDELLPPEVRVLSAQLKAVDELLDDERFLAPFRTRFPSRRGRHTIPMETYLRLMYLKKKYDLGYETLVQEVSDSVSWRRFCRISLGDRVPDASTLIKLTNGPCQGIAEEIHDSLIRELARKKIVRGRKLRVDTTVVEAEMRYPTDAGLLADGVRTITRSVKQLANAGATIEKFRDVSRSVQRRLGAIGRGLKQDDGEKKQATRAQMTKEILDIVRRMVGRANEVAEGVAREVEQDEASAPAIRRCLERLSTWLERTKRVIVQTEQVLSGNVHIKDRLVSLFDPDARPIRKGKLKAPTEFGYKVSVADEERGFVTDYEVAAGNPSDRGMLVPSVKRHIERVGKAPHGLAVDRGMVPPKGDAILEELGVKRRCLPKTGKKTEAERAKERSWWFRKLRAFRAGGEARISLLKRKYGWRRSRVRGLDRVTEWVGWGVIAHNLSKYAQIQAATAA